MRTGTSVVYEHVGIQQHRAPEFTVTGNENPASAAMAMLERIERSKPAWMKDPDRNCADYPRHLFYGEDSPRAIPICEGCPVQAQCLQWAIDHAEFGVWGGTSERQRKQIRKHGRIPGDKRRIKRKP